MSTIINKPGMSPGKEKQVEISEINLQHEINNLDARKYRLRDDYAKQSADSYVVKCGAMCIKFDTSGKPGACGLESASRYADRYVAESLARSVRNGLGERGRVVSFPEAVNDAIKETDMAIDALKQAVQAQVQAA